MTVSDFKGAVINRPLVLSIDLDSTFPESDADSRHALFSLLENHLDDVKLIYTSDGPAEALIQLAADAELPVPAVFMADAGTTLLKGDGSGAIEPLQRNIIQLWPGTDQVEKALKEIEGVELHEDHALCRETITVKGEEALEILRAKVAELGCHLEEHGPDDYYVLPYGVEKGTTLGRYIVEQNVSPAAVIAIGQSIGDMVLFGRGWRGAVFPHAPEMLRVEADRFHNVHILEHDGALGVLEALRLHGWLDLAAATA